MKAWKRLAFFLKTCFTSYLEQTNGQFSWKAKAKPQEKHFPKSESSVFHAGEELGSPYNAVTLSDYVQSLHGVILNILNYYKNR